MDYNGYEIAFDGSGAFSFTGVGFAQNVVIFGPNCRLSKKELEM